MGRQSVMSFARQLNTETNNLYFNKPLGLCRKKEFFVGLDSDGCVFNTMEIKHKECFIPQTIKHWGLQQISSLFRETWEFVNLYSIWRGTNRFPALCKVFELLSQRPKIIQLSFEIPNLSPLREWISLTPALDNLFLEEYARKVNNKIIEKALLWSHAVNKAIAEMVYGIPPFKQAVKAIESLQSQADLMVVSQTPLQALASEWQEHGLNKKVTALAGQEHGSKEAQLRHALALGYLAEHILMIGDAVGDLLAAQKAGVLFYPIIPGQEEESWEHFLKEALPRFLSGRYQGSYAAEIIANFKNRLPTDPPWLCQQAQ